MRVKSITITGMWSFGEPEVCLSDLGTHNIIIGKNNSGKSNILDAMCWLAKHASELGTSGGRIQVEQPVLHDIGDAEQEVPPRLSVNLQLRDDPDVLDKIRKIIHQDWVDHVISSIVEAGIEVGAEAGSAVAGTVAPVCKLLGMQELLEQLHGVFGPAARQEQIWPMLRDKVLPSVFAFTLDRFAKQLRFVSGWRSLRSPTHTSANIIKQLDIWRGAEPKDKKSLRIFQRVETIFADLMQTSDIRLVPQHGGVALNVDWRGRYLGIDSLGDGVHHLLMLAFELASAPDCILLVEEPETHLHPEAQRHLIAIIKRELKGQSIITTHSPVLLDAGLASNVFRVEHDGDKSSVQRCEATEDLYRTLDLLDVRASDILQANIVIWVEGPTDRMFLKKCLELRRPNFVEGLHYQIACYGGSLRAHLTLDEELTQLVNLMRLSRHVVMVCDSDRDSESADIDAGKQRLKAECEKVVGLYWVTDGREIENYIPDGVLTAAYRELLGDASIELELPRFGKLSDVLKATCRKPERGNAWKVSYDQHKARIMPFLLNHLTADDLHQWGLDKRLDELTEHIQKANSSLVISPRELHAEPV
ncbi:MAG: AAA family ATPase [Planctomycetes bacterium]|nr:AAA family ATPase [Planctomycetota bacterium]